MLDYNIYNDNELVLNNMLDFISYAVYYETHIIQPYILNLTNYLESQYIIKISRHYAGILFYTLFTSYVP